MFFHPVNVNLNCLVRISSIGLKFLFFISKFQKWALKPSVLFYKMCKIGLFTKVYCIEYACIQDISFSSTSQRNNYRYDTVVCIYLLMLNTVRLICNSCSKPIALTVQRYIRPT